MNHNASETRVQVKEKLLGLARAGLAGGVVLASTTLSTPSAAGAVSQSDARPCVAERVANVRQQASETAALHELPGGADNLAMWPNWGNWRNGWHNGWHNWHNWGNWHNW
jgi:hypothetical protein